MKPQMILVSLLILFLFIPASHGDVIEPGQKDVKISYQIINTGDYPDYIFLIHGSPSPSFEVVNSSPFTFYKFSTVSIYAIPKNNFKEDTFKNMDAKEIDNFFKTSPDVIRSDLVLGGSSKTVPVLDPLDGMLITLHVDSINQNKMNIKKMKVIYRYNDGSTAEETYTDQNSTPPPTKKEGSWWNSSLLYVLLPLLAMVGIIIIVYKKRR